MQGNDSGVAFATFARLFAGQVIATAAGMGLNIEDRFAGGCDLFQQGVQYGVLEHIGAVSGMIAMLVGEHRLVFQGFRMK